MRGGAEDPDPPTDGYQRRSPSGSPPVRCRDRRADHAQAIFAPVSQPPNDAVPFDATVPAGNAATTSPRGSVSWLSATADVLSVTTTGEFCAPRVTFIRIFECLSDLQEEDARPVAGDAIGMVVEEASYEPADPVALLSVVFGGTGVVE